MKAMLRKHFWAINLCAIGLCAVVLVGFRLRASRAAAAHSFDIQRAALDAALGNLSALSRSARIVPEVRAGQPAGFRVYSVRPGGPFAQVGLRNGDLVSSVNGLALTSPETALRVYGALKRASHLTVGVERDGQKIDLEYRVH